jgi:formate hydrogenlyase subunit 3/multisubunit Na+/H+ antiporter MnhD subunit
MSTMIIGVVLLPLLTAAALVPFTGRGEAGGRSRSERGLLLALAGALIAATARRGGPGHAKWRVAVHGRDRLGGGRLAAVMLMLTAMTSLATLVYAPSGLRGEGESRYFFLLHQFVLVGINGAFVTGDFFNLFVFFEIMLLASFVMVASARGRSS